MADCWKRSHAGSERLSRAPRYHSDRVSARCNMLPGGSNGCHCSNTDWRWYPPQDPRSPGDAKSSCLNQPGCEGLSMIPGKHLIVADQAQAFAQAVIDLMQDRERRKA